MRTARTNGRAWLAAGVFAWSAALGGCEGILGTGSLSDRTAADGSSDATTAPDGGPDAAVDSRGAPETAADIDTGADSRVAPDTGGDVAEASRDAPTEADVGVPPHCAGTLCGSTCCPAGAACTSGSDACTIPTLSSTAASALMLWLAADLELDCQAGSVASWGNLIGSHGATPFSAAALPDGGLVGPHTGPACGAAGHTINGIAVPYFPAPNDGPPYVNGTLDVDLAFLDASPFTIFVVERRWSGVFRPENFGGQFFLGTETPDEANTPTHKALQLGYVQYLSNSDGGPCTQLTFDVTFGGISSAIPADGNNVAAPVSIDAFRNGPLDGMDAYVNGILLGPTTVYNQLFELQYGSRVNRARASRERTRPPVQRRHRRGPRFRLRADRERPPGRRELPRGEVGPGRFHHEWRVMPVIRGPRPPTAGARTSRRRRRR